MWPEALRVCKEYLPPQKLRELQAEYEKHNASASTRDSDSLRQQGRRWEESGDYEHAVDCYLKIDDWSKAAELAIKFLDGEKALSVAEVAGPRLVAAGKHSAAAQLYLGVEMIKEAVDAFIVSNYSHLLTLNMQDRPSLVSGCERVGKG